jgi:phosphonate transport system substrate-binding protein
MKYSILLIILFLTACNDTWVEPDKEVWINFNDTSSQSSDIKPNVDTSNYLRVAVAAMSTPAETFFKYHQLFNYIEQKLGKKILLVQRKTYKEVNDLVKANEIDMAFVCSGAYVAGVRDSAFNLFLIPERENQRWYHAYIIVRKDSPYKTFYDLKGSKFVFSDSLSNTGMYYPLSRLQHYHTTAQDFFSSTYMSNAHDNSIELVSRGIVDGASVNSLIFDYLKTMEPEKVMNLKIIEISPPFGMPPVVVSKHINPQLREDIFNVMTNMVKSKEGRDILQDLMINRFVTNYDTLYDGIRKMCKNISNNPPAS